MPANQALWLTAVHRLERAIGEPVEAAVRSDTYFDAVTTINRARRTTIGVVEWFSKRAWHMLDLRPGNSLVEYLTAAGLDVFMLDWGVPDELDTDNDLERYVDWYIPRALAAVRRETGHDEVTLAGYCLGGVMAALYAAGHEDAAVRNLILMATPVDFDEMGAMVAVLREGRLDPEELIDDTGNVPADALYSGFYMLAPTVEVAQKATLLEHLWNDEFVEGFQAMAQWSRDHVPFPGAAFRQVVELLVRENALMSGSMLVGDRRVHLAEA